MTIGENIRRIRKEKGKTKKIASALGVKLSELMKGDSIWEALDKKHSDEIENT